MRSNGVIPTQLIDMAEPLSISNASSAFAAFGFVLRLWCLRSGWPIVNRWAVLELRRRTAARQGTLSLRH